MADFSKPDLDLDDVIHILEIIEDSAKESCPKTSNKSYHEGFQAGLQYAKFFLARSKMFRKYGLKNNIALTSLERAYLNELQEELGEDWESYVESPF
jgi:hypothetical protein